MQVIKKNVVLVRLKNPTLNIVTPPLGIGYLLKALKILKDINPIFLDFHLKNIDEIHMVEYLKKLNPMIIGFQLFSIDYIRFKKILPLVKKILPHTKLIAGGPHASALPEFILQQNPALDYVICGEGEVALPMLVEFLNNDGNINDIPNLVYRAAGKYIKNQIELIDITKYGSPDWESLKPDKYPSIQHGTFHKSTKVVPIITSRGCPYPCTFCAGFISTGKKIRTRIVEDVVSEIEFLRQTYDFEEFIIEDENFTFYKERVIQFANEIKRRKINCFFSFPNGIRLDRIDEDIVESLKNMGTYMVALGIESISNNTLARMGKTWDRNDIINKVNLFKKYRIIVQANFILGFRDDTIKDIKESIDFAMELNIDQVYFGNYIPLPGTKDFNILIENNEISLEDIDWNNYSAFYGSIPYHPKNISSDELLILIRKATKRFYFRPKIFLKFLCRTTRPVFIKSSLFRLVSLFFNK